MLCISLISGISFEICQWKVILHHCDELHCSFIVRHFNDVKKIDEMNKYLIDKLLISDSIEIDDYTDNDVY